MCELLAINSRRVVKANGILRTFFDDSPLHPHGWGLASFEGEALRLNKEPLCAADSNYLRVLLDEPIRATRLIAHIGNATRGQMSFENCHPFVGTDMSGRRWVIAHNGTMINDGLLQGYDRLVKGYTDSERVVCFLMDVIDEQMMRLGRNLDADERFSVLAQSMATLSDCNKLNLVIDDGEYTYAHTNTCLDTLFARTSATSTFLCTRPLNGEGWTALPKCRLLRYRDGVLDRIGPSHDLFLDEELYLSILAREGKLF